MIYFNAKGRSAVCVTDEPITTGSVGMPVEFTFSSEWDGLAKVAVFQTDSTTVDVYIPDGTCVVPPEAITKAGRKLVIGVYGANGIDVVIPTVYADAGFIMKGAEPSGIEPTPVTPSLVDQILAAAQAAQDAAEDAEEAVQSIPGQIDEALEEAKASGEFDGPAGPNGTSTWTIDSSKIIRELSNFVFAPAAELVGSPDYTPQNGDVVIISDGRFGSIGNLFGAGLVRADLIGNLKGPKGDPGFSPTASVTKITNGHRVTITDQASPNGQSFDVLDGAPGPEGPPGKDGGFTEALKQALLQLAQKVAYIDDQGQTYYQALYDALYPPKELVSISAVYTQSGAVYDTDTLDDLKADLVVTGTYDDQTTATIPASDYTLSGTLTAGTSTITVTCSGKTDTFTVTVTHAPGVFAVSNTLTGCTNSNTATSVAEGASYSGTITASSGYTLTGASVSITIGGEDITATAYSSGAISIASVTGALVINVSAVAVVLNSISAVYTQSGTVYDSDTLDSLKADLAVTAVYSDSSTQTVPSSDYTLSGTLTAGTSTITVSYGGKTTMFSVTVTAHAYTRSDYAAQDKMLLWLDGIDNTANGHDAASTIWEDLSGNGHNVTYNDVGTISADHYNPNGKGCSIVTMSAIRTKIEAGTVEVVMKGTHDGASHVILPFGNTRGACIISSNTATPPFVCLHPSTEGKCFETTGGVQTFNSLGYVDGVAGTPLAGKTGGSWATYMMNLIFCYKNTGSYPANSDIYAIRIYDKELTAEEIALNAAVDRSRFGGS